MGKTLSMKHIILVLIMTLVSTFSAQAADGRTETAIFAAGCFWCVQHDFEQVDGVTEVVSGYTGGTSDDPTYERHAGHVEAVRVTFDPAKTSYERLLQVFWDTHDPFDAEGQFCDKGPSYHAAIFALNDAQRRAAEQSRADVAAKYGRKVITPVTMAGTFYRAEDYHQTYVKDNPLAYKLYRYNCGRDARLEALKKQ